MNKDSINVAFIGNPNCGKTTIFNSYTGAKLKVANWPGVTVEKMERSIKYKAYNLKLIDLPGIYSMSSYSMEEIVSKRCLLSNEVDVIVNVIDASSLERNLFLTFELLALKKPMILAVNMMDIAERKGITINFKKLSKLLDIPCIGISAKTRRGLIELIDEIIIYKKVTKTITENNSYKIIPKIVNCCVEYRKNDNRITEKIDNILINRYLGIPIFLCIMTLVFYLTFSLGNNVKELFEIALKEIVRITSLALQKIGTDNFIQSMIIDGILTGVGTVLVFIPNIFILFTLLAILEDTGYMARVVYIMNGVMKKLRLPGKSFIPMILGFGCTVPAVMSTNTLDNEEDKIKTIFLIPFMSCSAKIPIYILICGMFFHGHEVKAILSVYIIGIITAVLIAKIINKTDKNKNQNTMIIELPEYRIPSFNTVKVYVIEKIKDYLYKAGTTIFMASIALWLILNFNSNGMVSNIKYSFGAIIGKKMVPFFKPLGLGYWQIIIALISGLTAKELVVSSLGVIIGSTEGVIARNYLSNLGFTNLNAFCLMIFCLLYIPCIASIATIKKETNLKYCITSIFIQLASAWSITTIIYQIGRILNI